MIRARTVSALLLASILAVTSAIGALAQSASSTLGQSQPDLAAMVLPASSWPDGATLLSEGFESITDLSGNSMGVLTEQAIRDTNLASFYSSYYRAGDGVTNFRTYAEFYPTVADAEAGFALLEDETIFAEAMEFSDQPLDGIGAAPSEISTGSYTPGGSEKIFSIDITFRVDTLLVGIGIDTSDPAGPDQAMALDFARALEARVMNVLAGNTPEDVLAGFSQSTLALTGAATTQLEGYVASPDSINTYLDLSTPGILGGYLRSYAVSEVSQLPVITIVTAKVDDESAIFTTLSSQGEMLEQYLDATEIESLSVAGADVAVGFQMRDIYGVSQGEPNSARIIAAVGMTLIVIDVQGAPSAESAIGAATALADAQIACLTIMACIPVGVPVQLLIDGTSVSA